MQWTDKTPTSQHKLAKPLLGIACGHVVDKRGLFNEFITEETLAIKAELASLMSQGGDVIVSTPCGPLRTNIPSREGFPEKNDRRSLSQ